MRSLISPGWNIILMLFLVMGMPHLFILYRVQILLIQVSKEVQRANTGVHLFGIRAKDAKGAWSLDNKWLFVKDAIPAATPGIVKVEYYIDNDLVYGNATDTVITQNTNLSDLTHSIDAGTISAGLHIFGIRVQDANGAWSVDNKWIFIKYPARPERPGIVKVEYYIDTDPGYDKATSLKITPGINLNDSTINLNSALFANNTTHTLGIRAKDENGI